MPVPDTCGTTDPDNVMNPAVRERFVVEEISGIKKKIPNDSKDLNLPFINGIQLSQKQLEFQKWISEETCNFLSY